MFSSCRPPRIRGWPYTRPSWLASSLFISFVIPQRSLLQARQTGRIFHLGRTGGPIALLALPANGPQHNLHGILEYNVIL